MSVVSFGGSFRVKKMWFLRPGMNLEYALLMISAFLFTVLLVMPFHEISHGFVAYKLGDDTAKNFGGLSLNLLDHIDLFGALSLILFGMCWSKPFLVDRSNFRHERLGVCLTSLAGPCFNILVAFLMGIFGGLFVRISFLPVSFLRVVYSFFQCVTLVNLRIAFFNLLPVPTLDGFGVVASFLPSKLLYEIRVHRFYVLIAFMFLMFMGVFSVPVNFLTIHTYQLINRVVGIYI